jgi:hypothetical protein
MSVNAKPLVGNLDGCLADPLEKPTRRHMPRLLNRKMWLLGFSGDAARST